MKRFSILALIVTGLTFATLSSCSKDDDSSNSSSTNDARDLSVGKYIGTFTTEIAGKRILTQPYLTFQKELLIP